MAKRRDVKKLADLKIRMRETLRQRVEDAAAAKGMSMSAEMVERLEQSFEKAKPFGGLELYRIATMVTAAFGHAGWQCAVASGKSGETADWLQDPETYGAAMAAVIRALLIGDPETDQKTARMRLENMLINLPVTISRLRLKNDGEAK